MLGHAMLGHLGFLDALLARLLPEDMNGMQDWAMTKLPQCTQQNAGSTLNHSLKNACAACCGPVLRAVDPVLRAVETLCCVPVAMNGDKHGLGAWDPGHGSWVMGHGAWVMGHGAWVMGHMGIVSGL